MVVGPDVSDRSGLPCDSNLVKTMVSTGDIRVRAVDWGKDIFGTYMRLVSYEWVRWLKISFSSELHLINLNGLSWFDYKAGPIDPTQIYDFSSFHLKLRKFLSLWLGHETQIINDKIKFNIYIFMLFKLIFRFLILIIKSLIQLCWIQHSIKIIVFFSATKA